MRDTLVARHTKDSRLTLGAIQKATSVGAFTALQVLSAVDDDGEIAAAQQMSPHVDLLHRAVVTAGWKNVRYPEFDACGPYSTNVVPDRELSIA